MQVPRLRKSQVFVLRSTSERDLSSTMMNGIIAFALLLVGAIAAPTREASISSRQASSNLTVDLDYAVYQGASNATTKLNVWKGSVNRLSMIIGFRKILTT